MSEQTPAVERIWVGIPQAAEITGRRVGYLRQLAASAWENPKTDPPLKVRFRSKRYEFWLPDLMVYLETSQDAYQEQDPEVEQIWVSTSEGAELTGYHMDYLRQIAYRISKQPENERRFKIRMRSGRYEFWLPDLISYAENEGYKHRPKLSENK